MDPKEVKAILKTAREAIRNKDFKEALKHCKAILAKDKNNYNALVFVGVAAEGLEQLDQAVKAYKRAIETSPDQLLAWQGLCGFYEKHPCAEYNSDLVNVYQKLAEFHEGDKEKQTETLLKLARLDVRLGAIEMTVHIFKDAINNSADEVKKRQYKQELIDILCNEEHLASDTQNEITVIEMCDSVFESSDVTFNSVETVVTVYLKLRLKHDKVRGLLDTCSSLCKLFPGVTFPLEVSVIIYLDNMAEQESSKPSADLLEIMNKLKEKSPQSVYLTVAEGVKSLCDKDYVKAQKQLSSVLEELSQVVCVHSYLADTYLALRNRTEAEKSCSTGLNVLQSKRRILTGSSVAIATKMKVIQSRVYLQSGKKAMLEQAVQILSEINKTPEVDDILGFVYLKLGNITEAETLVDGTKRSAGLDAWVQFHKGDFQAAELRLKLALEESGESSTYLLMLGRTLWEMWRKDKSKQAGEKCYLSLLKAAKLDPYNSDTFLYLGHFYLEVQKDKVKSKKCYQKAYDLDCENEAAGAALCDVMSATGQEEEAYAILLNVTSKASAGSEKWAWLRLGLYQVQHDSPSTAVTSFQSALRADPADNHVWECLAEAYLNRGSLTAALKAFTKASELQRDSLYCLYQIATIKQTIGVYQEAIAEYKLILESSPNYVPALKGLGETFLLLAKTYLKQYFHRRVQQNCQDALMYLTRAATHRPDMSCLWKLMGDACTIMHPLNKETFSLMVDRKLLVKDQETGTCRIDLQQTLALGAKCYGRALKAIPECASLWHDLGVNFFHQSQQALEEGGPLINKAVNSLKKALSLDVKCHLHWNALGMVFCSKGMSNPDQAQHCFIKSIQAEANNVEAWTNLGALYLKHGNIELAHESFKVAQSLEPSYVACWIGQALIAETVGHTDAMDLFRHTTELGNHIEGATGYAHWVCTMLQDKSRHDTDLYRYSIQQMAAIPAASDALARYIDRVSTDATAYNMYGLLLEQQNLFCTAADAFSSALKLMTDDDTEQLKKTRINYARVLCKLNRYAEALQVYEMIGELTVLEDVCNQALSFYKSGKYQSSFQAYEKAFGMAETEEEKSHILTAQGMVLYKLAGADAKSILFQSSQLTPPSSHGLLALCAFGILQSDMTLTLAVLQELLSNQDLLPQTAHLMVTAHTVLENNWRAALNYIQQSIHKYPDKAEMWQLLSSVLLQHCNNQGPVKAAANCARCAMTLNPELHNAVELLTSGQLAAGHHSQVDRNNNALYSAQRAVHLNPASAGNWCNLASAVHSQVTVTGQDRLNSVHLKILEWIIKTDCKPTVREWCSLHRVISLAGSNRLSEAVKCLENMSGSGVYSDLCESVDKVLSGDKGAMSEHLIKSRSDILVIEALLESCDREGVTVNLDDIFLEDSQSDNRRREFMERLLKMVYSYKQSRESGTEDEASSVTAAVNDLLKLDQNCSLAHLIKGVVNMSSNPRMAKYSLHRVIESSEVSNVGYDASLARRFLLKLLGKKDTDLIQNILEEANEMGDKDTIEFYENLTDK